MVHMFMHMCHLKYKEGFVVKKMEPPQNVLVAISFDLKFTYISVGWEGSAYDSCMLNDALTRLGGIYNSRRNGMLKEMRYVKPCVRNPWIELTLENKLARRGCPRAYKHKIKLILNPCGTLGS